MSDELRWRNYGNLDFISVLAWSYDNAGETWMRRARAAANAEHLGPAADMLEAATHRAREPQAAMAGGCSGHNCESEAG
jgi:hypothetical protein